MKASRHIAKQGIRCVGGYAPRNTHPRDSSGIGGEQVFEAREECVVFYVACVLADIPLVECVYSHYSKQAILARVGPDESGCCCGKIGEAVSIVSSATGNAVQRVLEHMCVRIPVALSLAYLPGLVSPDCGRAYTVPCSGSMAMQRTMFSIRCIEAFHLQKDQQRLASILGLSSQRQYEPVDGLMGSV